MLIVFYCPCSSCKIFSEKQSVTEQLRLFLLSSCPKNVVCWTFMCAAATAFTPVPIHTFSNTQKSAVSLSSKKIIGERLVSESDLCSQVKKTHEGDNYSTVSSRSTGKRCSHYVAEAELKLHLDKSWITLILSPYLKRTFCWTITYWQKHPFGLSHEGWREN